MKIITRAEGFILVGLCPGSCCTFNGRCVDSLHVNLTHLVDYEYELESVGARC